MRPALAFLPVLALLATPALAEDAPVPFTYAMFEQAVPHVDLAFCPKPLAAPGRFCRLTVVHDQLNVFAFSEEGDQPLAAMHGWPTDLLQGLMD